MTTPERTAEIVARLAELNAQSAALLAELHGQSRTMLDQYIDAHLHRREGFTVAFSDLYSAFKAWLPERERESWSKGRVRQELPQGLLIVHEGRSDQPRKMVQGLSWHPSPPPPEPPKPEPPKNPDYDEDKLFWVARNMQKEGMKVHQIAACMNELGHRDKTGEPWDQQNTQALLWLA